MRLRGKTDANHQRIMRTLQQAHCGAVSTANLGNGVPDILACSPSGMYIWLEVKDGSLPPSKRGLTPHQVEFHRAWPGKIAVVLNEEDALRAVGVEK